MTIFRVWLQTTREEPVVVEADSLLEAARIAENDANNGELLGTNSQWEAVDIEEIEEASDAA